MKKLKLILLLTLLTFIGTLQVMGYNEDSGPTPAADGGFVPDVDDGGWEPAVFENFTICNKVGRNCITITTETINNNQKYDLFEIKNREIYLDNSDITLEILRPIEQQYVIHISGTNKIEYLNNIFVKEYIPFTVEGEGTLEIVTSNQIKKNTAGETYYKCWKINIADDEFHCGALEADPTKNTKTVSNVKKINVGDVHLLRQTNTKAKIPVVDICLTEAEVNTGDNTVTFAVPKYGYTVTDIKNKFAENADAFYNAEVNLTMSPQEFNERTPRLLKSYAGANDNVLTADGRTAFITSLINKGNTLELSCDDYYLTPTKIVTDETQITASWGNEYINTELPRRFSKTGSYLINVSEEKEMITTTKKDNIVFESTEEFDPNYHLVVDDITEKITEIQSASVQAKTDKVLVELYDIYMADENDNIVKMEDGTYTIKVELSEQLKKYKDYQVIYISEENTVELIDARVEGDYIVFNTTHLSKYGIVGREVKTGNIVNPNTADSLITYGLILASLAVAIALVIVRINKLKKAN